jgi:PPE-repeat protein
VFDFGALPPEINSGRMYTGPGSAPMMAAASAWDGLAAELSLTAQGYGSVLGELTSSWLGPASRSMMSAVAPYVSWISAVSAQAEETAFQARAAAAAFDAAFGSMVPPPVIEANRVLLIALIATNFFGQNTTAIAATEAQYIEMWAQDAAAMYGYAAASALAMQLSLFTDPPSTTNPSGAGGQSTAVAQATATPAGQVAQTVAATIPQLLSNAAQPLASSSAATDLPWPFPLIYNTVNDYLTQGLPTAVNNWLGLIPADYFSVIGQSLQGYFFVGLPEYVFGIVQQLYNGPLGTTAGATGAFIPSPQFAALGAGGWTFGHVGSGIPANLSSLNLSSASLASSLKVGGLSVPASWANGAPGAAEQAATKALGANLVGSPGGSSGPMNAALGGAPMGSRGAQRTGNLGVRYGFRYPVLTRPPSGG